MTESAPRQIGLLEDENHVPRNSRQDAQKSQVAEASMDIASGSTAGMISKVFEYPFDTVKVRLQSQSNLSSVRYSGPVDCFRKSLKSDGILGLYRGLSAPIVGAALETSSLFFSYRLSQDLFRYATNRGSHEDLSLPALVACGASSGAFTSLLLTPVELVKCQMQVPEQSSRQAPLRPLSVVSLIYRHHGLWGFWHGQLGTLIRETGGSAAWFGSYEAVTSFFKTGVVQSDRGSISLPIWQQLVAGASAGMCYNFIFYPADTIKSRMQTEDLPRTSEVSGARRTFASIGKEIWQEHGVRGLYRGCGITVARSAPSSAMIFTIYEGLRGLFK